MRVVVTGGRYYDNREYVWLVLDELHAAFGITLIATGACYKGGADLLAENWAKHNEIAYFGLPAKFKTTGQKWAGPLRNGELLDLIHPDMVVAFPGDTGTADCVEKALDKGFLVHDKRNI